MSQAASRERPVLVAGQVFRRITHLRYLDHDFSFRDSNAPRLIAVAIATVLLPWPKFLLLENKPPPLIASQAVSSPTKSQLLPTKRESNTNHLQRFTTALYGTMKLTLQSTAESTIETVVSSRTRWGPAGARTGEHVMPKPTHINSETLIGNPVISISNGELIAKAEDVQIDPTTHAAVAVITAKGTLLNRKVKAIAAEEVEVWGQDAILVKKPDIIVGEEELDGLEECLSVSEEIRGYEVVAEDGTRIGILGDVALDSHGQIVGYEMSEVEAEGRVAVANWIDVKATRSLGPDVLVVKSEYV